MNEEKKITEAGPEIIDQVRALTEENAHTEARIKAVQFFSNAYAINNRGNAFAWKSNPFQPILAALRKLAEQHEAAGSLSTELHTVRLYLWNLAAEVVAPACELAPAARALRRVL